MKRKLGYEKGILQDFESIEGDYPSHVDVILTRCQGIAADMECYLKLGEATKIHEAPDLYELYIDGIELEGFYEHQGYRIVYSVSDVSVIIIRVHYVPNMNTVVI
ncbi:MAG: hypothetical protein HQM14_15620 [SAR324 cluster bacterium]|nr:hypothetical protein [SAR324 cluster bacterium]